MKGSSRRRNYVHKYHDKFNKAAVFKDRKKEDKRGYEKHRYKSSECESEG